MYSIERKWKAPRLFSFLILRETYLLAILDKTKAEIWLEKAKFDLIYYKKSIDDLCEDTLQINSLESTPEQNQQN